MEDILFKDWAQLLRTAVMGVLAYASLLAILRVSGKRTLAKMNAFDFVVTVALGSILATVLLNQSVTLSQGAVAFAVLVGLQFLITWSSVRMRWIRHLITGEPRMLVFKGECLPDALRRARVTDEEIHAAVRSTGLAGVEQAEAVVLETDGTFSVVKGGGDGPQSSLEEVKRPDRGFSASSGAEEKGPE